MARTIRILADSVANQIAAGEVVERPASVVKELVENALDAGAKRIEVQIEQGGKRSIRVADDGSGMGREDALLSLDRHATSKIRNAEDLRAIASLGFRGEALPSISSVSRLTIETSPGRSETGTRVRGRGGEIVGVEDFARVRGTTVLVENLFFNAPARGKFLRSPAAETRAVGEALTPLALAHPEVAFLLVSDGRSLFDLPPTANVIERIATLWGEEAAGELISVDFEDSRMKVRGAIQRPDAAKPGFRRTALFVRGRPFRDIGLLKASDRGYRTTIPREHRPWLFLFLEVPDGSVDVNVHPTKAEVRFRDRGTVEEFVEKGIRHALEGLESAATFDRQPVAPVLTVREREPGRGQEVTRPDEDQMALFLSGRREGPSRGSDDRVDSGEGGEGSGGGVERIGEKGLPPALVGEQRPRLWQAHRSWIVAEVRDGLLLIDQHAAHERVLFEEIMRGFMEVGRETQQLLFPLTIRLAPAEYAAAEDLKGFFGAVGFEVEGFGGDTVMVQGVPNPHPYFDAERSFREMIAELTHGSELTRSARNQHERVAMSFACKSAIKAGQPLDDREIQELFDRLFATQLPFHDVHGRPTTVRLSRTELERKFGR
jgi:DNA mismatch repair protein MutL